MVFDDELMFKPGTQYLYSNVGYSLLAMIIEKTTGQSYGDYVQKNIFDVCGMAGSGGQCEMNMTAAGVDNKKTKAHNTYQGE